MKRTQDTRPWGSFLQFTENEPSTIKIITVNPGEAFSLQYHNNRSEFWKILSGSGTVIIGEETHAVKKGDEFMVDVKVKHRVEAGAEPIEFLEISFGDFSENDIVRLEDKYGRS